MESIDVSALQEWIRQGKDFLLLDVRESFEHETLNIGGRNIPLGEISTACADMPRDKDIVVYCAHGVRSIIAIQKMETKGLKRLFNLRGGIYAIPDPKVLTQG